MGSVDAADLRCHRGASAYSLLPFLLTAPVTEFDPPTIAVVVVPAPLKALDYLLPDGQPVAPGCRVEVPLGPRRVVGVVWALKAGDTSALKPIGRVLDAEALLPTSLRALLEFAASYYVTPIGEVLRTALPPQARATRAPIRVATPAFRRRDDAVIDPSWLRRAPRQLAVWLALADGPRALESLKRQFGDTVSEPLRALATRGAIEACAAPLDAVSRTPIALNADQQHAVAAIVGALGGFQRFLLEGITGSGKTNVYLAAAQAALKRGQQVLMLVPEIGLTPQFLARIEAALDAPVLKLHSGLNDGERQQSWLGAAQHAAQVLIGTRSAVFAPLPNLGLILIDEEHDGSYKQRDGFRYHARDLAIKRAQLANCPIVLGSATPSLETLRAAELGAYQRLRLSLRATGAIAPEIRVLDCRALKLHEGLSPPLLTAIERVIERREHAIVFLNRRGFAPVVLCHDCGERIGCPSCDATLTWHQADARLRCHHCGYACPKIDHCPKCASLNLLTQGEGTERIEQALQRSFPGVPVVRVDRDSTARKDGLKRQLDTLKDDAPGILIGTQMLAKGHDLHRVTLAVILNVDQGLFSADFRAPERLAQLIVQVAGRAGRGDRPGHVLLQTHHPQHPLLRTLIERGYRAYADGLLSERRELGLPPYAHHALLRAEGRNEAQVLEFLNQLMSATPIAPSVRVLGPLPATLKRRADLYRWQWLLETDTRTVLRDALDALISNAAATPRGVRWFVDVDPQDLS
jgi:primosomal protein N' (replication factor Y) (superfamily II helicase)